MADVLLRQELIALGFTPGPITDSTRGILKKKLQKLRADAAKSTKITRRSGKSLGSEVTPRNRQQHVLENSGEDDEGELWAFRDSPTPARTVHGSSRMSEESRRVSVRLHTEDSEDWRPDRSSLEEDTFPRASALSSNYLGEQLRSSTGRERASEITDQYSEKYRSFIGGGGLSRDAGERGDYLAERNRASLGGGRSFGGTDETSSYLGESHRSSFGGERSLGGTSEQSNHLGERYRSLLGGQRISVGTSSLGYLEQENRPSLSGYRYLGGTSGYGSLGDKYRPELGVEGFSGGTAAYAGSLGEKRRSLLGEERVLGSTAAYGSPELRSRTAVNRSGWLGLEASRDGDRRLYGCDELSKSKNYPGLRDSISAQSRSAWSRSLEYYLSRLLRGLSVLLVVIFLGILIVKSGIFSSTQKNEMKLLTQECSGNNNRYCKAKQKQMYLQILSELYEFLSLEAGSFECGNPSGLKSKCVPVERAKEYVTSVGGHLPEKFDDALDWLINRERHLGIWAKGEDDQIVTSRSHLFCVESSQPRLGTICRLKNAIYTAISNLFLALFGLLVLWFFLIYLKYHWKKLEDEEKQMFEMVEKIIDVVKRHYKDYTFGLEQNPYIGIVHVRDSIIMPQDRKRQKRVWDRAVQFIENNESRLRTESQRVAGADLRVWRWIQTRNDGPGVRM